MLTSPQLASRVAVATGAGLDAGNAFPARSVQFPSPRGLRRRHKWLLGCLLVLGLGGATALIALGAQGRSKQVEAVQTARLPRVDGKRIIIPESYAKRINLESREIGQAGVVPAIAVVGNVIFDPAHVARIGARLRGIVREVYRYEGAAVKAGDALAAIDSPELGEAQAAVVTLDAANRVAQQHREREARLAERQLTTARDVEEAGAMAQRSTALLSAAEQRVSALSGKKPGGARAGLGGHVLSSPLRGTIIERSIAKGQLVDASHPAFLVADLDRLWVELSVFERQLPYVKIGDRVELHAESAGASDVVIGEVAQVGAVLNAETRGATVRVRIDNRARLFRPGQSVNAVIRANAAAVANGLTVPSGAVIHVDGVPSVFVFEAPNSVTVARVELGETNGQDVEIKSGVKRGQRVVVRGTAELRNELFR